MPLRCKMAAKCGCFFSCIRRQDTHSQNSTPSQHTTEGPSEGIRWRSSDVVPLEFDGAFKQHIKLGRLLDSGGYSDVHLGRMFATKEIVAVKKIHASNTTTNVVDKVSQEVSALKKLQHGNVIHLMGVYSMKRHVALIFELMQVSLWRLVMDGQVSLEETLELAVLHEVLQGLAFIHDKGMMHGDIKPHNILIGVKDTVTVKIADFGSCGETGTLETRRRGTLLFLSPETLESYVGSKVTQLLDTACDIWALGITLVTVATGNIPFLRLSPKKLMQAHRDLAEFPLGEELTRAKVERSEEWQALVSSCLAMTPEQRTSSQALLQLSILKDRGDLDQLRPFVADVLARQTTRHDVMVLF